MKSLRLYIDWHAMLNSNINIVTTTKNRDKRFGASLRHRPFLRILQFCINNMLRKINNSAFFSDLMYIILKLEFRTIGGVVVIPPPPCLSKIANFRGQGLSLDTISVINHKTI